MSSKMVTTRTVPWMKLGKIAETLDVESAIEQGGLDFTVSARDSAFAPEGAHDGTSWTEFPARKIIVRDDNEEPFDFVSSGYRAWQYREAFDFMDSVDPTYVAAGTLKGGRQGFIVATLPGLKEMALLDGDEHELYVVLRTSHDRTRKMEVAVMPLRLRCMNQLTLATFTRGAKQRITVGHTRNMEVNLEEAKRVLENTTNYARELDGIARRLDAVQLETETATDVLKRVLPDKPKRDEKVGEILRLWREDETIGYPQSGWGLVNAVSSFYDWGRIGGNSESRFTASLNGQTYNAVNRTAALVLSRH